MVNSRALSRTYSDVGTMVDLYISCSTHLLWAFSTPPALGRLRGDRRHLAQRIILAGLRRRRVALVQHHDADERGQQDHRGDLERQQILAEQRRSNIGRRREVLV